MQQCLETFLGAITESANGISWTEARGPAKHPAMQRTACFLPKAKNSIAQNTKIAKGQKS